MSVSSIIDAHINPTGSIQAVIQNLNSLPDSSLESEAEALGSYLQVILSAENVSKESIKALLVAFDQRIIDSASCSVKLPLCTKALGEILRDSLSSLSIDRGRGGETYNIYIDNSSRPSEVVQFMLCYSVSACIYLSQAIGLTGLIRALDTYLPKNTTSDLIIQRCLFSKLFTPDMETLLKGVDTLCARGRYTTLSALMPISNTLVSREITMYLLMHRPRDFIQAFIAGLEIEANHASTLSEKFTLRTIAQQLIKRFPCEVPSSSFSSSLSEPWIDSFVNYVAEPNSDRNLAFMAAFYNCFFTWAFYFHSLSTIDPTTEDCWALKLLDKLVIMMTMCTRATSRFLLGLCACFSMLANTEMITFICGQTNKPQSASLGADLNLKTAILMKLVKAIRMFMQVSPALELWQLLFIDMTIPYVQSLILSDRGEAIKQLNTIIDLPATINVAGNFARSLTSRNDLLLHIVVNAVILEKDTNSTGEPGSTVTPTEHGVITENSKEASVDNINSPVGTDCVAIASVSRIAHTSLPGLLAEIFGQEPIPGDLLSNLHKSIPKSLEEAISLLQYPSGQPQSRYYHILSLASLPPLLKNTSQVIIISKARELLDSILWLDDIATLQTLKGKSAWHALKARSISGAIERAPYVVGTTLIERSLQKHKATVGGFMTGLRALTAVAGRLTARQALCLISTLNQRSQVFCSKIELIEPTFFTLASLVDVTSRSLDKQAICCTPLCCNNYIKHTVKKCLSSINEPINNSITKGEKIFISTLIHTCAQTVGALKALFLEFSKQNSLPEQSHEHSVPSPFLLTNVKSLEHTLKLFSSSTTKFRELSEEGCDISIGNIIYNTNTELAKYQTDYVTSLMGFDVIDKITQTIIGESPIDIECRSLLRAAAENVLNFFGFKEHSELFLKTIKYHQN